MFVNSSQECGGAINETIMQMRKTFLYWFDWLIVAARYVFVADESDGRLVEAVELGAQVSGYTE